MTKAFLLHTQRSLKLIPPRLHLVNRIIRWVCSAFLTKKEIDWQLCKPLFKRTGIPCLRRKGSISCVNCSKGPSFNSTWNNYDLSSLLETNSTSHIQELHMQHWQTWTQTLFKNNNASIHLHAFNIQHEREREILHQAVMQNRLKPHQYKDATTRSM